MLILALDTTTRAGSVALARNGTVLHEQSGDPARTHAQRLPTEIMTACDAAGVRIADVELFAVAAGPGSFTGLRIGIAAVQGLAMAWNRQVVPISTLEALAIAAPVGATRVAAWMDAHRGEVFAQLFERMADAFSAPRALTEAMAAPAAEVIRAHGDLLHGAHVIGDGAVRYAEVVHSSGVPDIVISETVPTLAGAIAHLAGVYADRAVLPHAVMPIYVRRPDVEMVREKRTLNR